MTPLIKVEIDDITQVFASSVSDTNFVRYITSDSCASYIDTSTLGPVFSCSSIIANSGSGNEILISLFLL